MWKDERARSLDKKPYTVYSSGDARGRSWKRVVVGLLLFLAVAAALAAGGFYLWMDQLLGQMSVDPQIEDIERELESTTTSEPSEEDPVSLPEGSTYLILGSDSRGDESEEYGRSDTLIIVHLDPDQDFASILSIPRDLRVEIPGYGVQKINAAFALGGPILAIRTVQQSLGIDLDHYVQIDFEGFRKVTAALGGIFVDVDRRYYYAGGQYENIDLQPGYQALTGEAALDFVRFRHDQNFDFGRMERQQRFLGAVKEQALRWENASRLPEVIDIVVDHISTDDIGTREVLRTAYWGAGLGGNRIKKVSLDVTVEDVGGISYVVAQEGTLWNARRELFSPPGGGTSAGGEDEFEEGTTSTSSSSSTTTTQPEVDLEGAVIDVLNGSGAAGAAGSAAEWFESHGAAVQEVGDAESFDVAETYVGHPPGNKDTATSVAGFLGGAPLREQVQRERATVVVGADFELPEGFEAVPPQERIPDGATWASLAGDVGFPVLAPAKLPDGYHYRDHRVYEIETRSGAEPAIKVVYRLRNEDHYMGIMETTFLDAPAAAEGEEIAEGDVTYTLVETDGAIERVWWEKDGTLYWITNTLFDLLSREEMLDMARSMERVR